MAGQDDHGALPTKSATKTETVVLVRSLLVDWNVLDHLKVKKMLDVKPAECCKPDGGSCCVYKK